MELTKHQSFDLNVVKSGNFKQIKYRICIPIKVIHKTYTNWYPYKTLITDIKRYTQIIRFE